MLSFKRLVPDDVEMQANSTVGTPSYLSPEMCKNNPYGMKVRVSRLGHTAPSEISAMTWLEPLVACATWNRDPSASLRPWRAFGGARGSGVLGAASKASRSDHVETKAGSP